MEGTTRGGRAGRRGDDVRSDCWVAVELTDAGGLQLEVRSKVGALYGPSITKGLGDVLQALGIENARVELEDQGALPWVIQARLEAAISRGGGEVSRTHLPPARVAPTPGGTFRDRLRRSRLYLPGNEPKFMVNAGLHGPDGVILDLEDSVHPDEKDAARFLVLHALRNVDFGGAERMVRINQGPLGLMDLDAVVPEGPDMILLPKVETPDQVSVVHERIREIQERWGLDHPVWLMPILESALGVENAFAIATAAPSMAALTIGLEDYTADMGVVKTPEGAESLWARSRLVNAARAGGVQAIDSVYGDVADEEGLLAWGRRARGMGFQGMGCIHPRQIRIIHEAFAPSREELAKALKIVAAFEEAQRKGLGVVSLGTKMIDRPVVLRARRLVERAREAGLVAEAEPGEAPRGPEGGEESK
jgi:citrate lyase subunit beta / citryl-CoA lyase